MKLVSVYTRGNGSQIKEVEPGVYDESNIARVTKGICSEYALECIWEDEAEYDSEGFEADRYSIEPLTDNGLVYGHSVQYDRAEIFACMLEEYA